LGNGGKFETNRKGGGKEEREVKAKKWIEKKFSQGFLPKVKKAVRR